MRALHPMITLVPIGWLLLAPGCAHQQESQTFDEALFQYAHGIRWAKPGYVTDYLPSAHKLHFVSDQERLQNVRITHCRATRIVALADDSVRVTLRVTWYALDQGRVLRTVVLQRWEQKEKHWTIREQRLIAGAPLPLFRTIAALQPVTGGHTATPRVVRR